MVTQRIRKYELVMVLSPEATEDEVSATLERVDEFIANAGGTVAEHNNWGLRQLAFPVENFREGNYVLTRFELDAEAVSEFKRTLKASNDIIRFLVTKV